MTELQSHVVFISYSKEDKPVADEVCTLLEGRGLRCWIAPRDVPPGRKWAAAITDAIDHAKALVLIFSGHANTSPAIESEVDQAFSNGVPVFPVRIKNVEPSDELKFRIRTAHWLDAFKPPIQQEINRLADSIWSLLPSQPGKVVPEPVGRRSTPVIQLRRVFAASIAALAAVGIAIAGWFYLHRGPETSEESELQKVVIPSDISPMAMAILIEVAESKMGTQVVQSGGELPRLKYYEELENRGLILFSSEVDKNAPMQRWNVSTLTEHGISYLARKGFAGESRYRLEHFQRMIESNVERPARKVTENGAHE